MKNYTFKFVLLIGLMFCQISCSKENVSQIPEQLETTEEMTAATSLTQEEIKEKIAQLDEKDIKEFLENPSSFFKEKFNVELPEQTETKGKGKGPKFTVILGAEGPGVNVVAAIGLILLSAQPFINHPYEFCIPGKFSHTKLKNSPDLLPFETTVMLYYSFDLSVVPELQGFEDHQVAMSGTDNCYCSTGIDVIGIVDDQFLHGTTAQGEPNNIIHYWVFGPSEINLTEFNCL